MFQLEEQVDLFIEALDGRFALLLRHTGVDEQFLYCAIVARFSDLFNLIDGPHAAFTQHLDDFEFSIKDCT